MKHATTGLITGIKQSGEPIAMPEITHHGELHGDLNSKVTLVFDGEQTQPLTALWDTGSNITLVDPGIIDRLLVLPLPSSHGEINSITGALTADIYTADLLCGDIVLSDVEVWASPVASKGVHIIIGMDVISKGALTIAGGSMLTFSA